MYMYLVPVLSIQLKLSLHQVILTEKNKLEINIKVVYSIKFKESDYLYLGNVE